MFTLKLDELTEERLDLTWEEGRASLSSYLKTLSQIDFDFETPLEVKAAIWRAGKSILIKGTLRTTLQLRCVRCLKEFSYPLSSAFDLTLYPLNEAPSEEETELSGEDMERGFFEGGEIRLSEIACEQVFLEIPYQPFCQEGCKGLCPKCGRDLNFSSCDCGKEELETGFSALRNLKLDS